MFAVKVMITKWLSREPQPGIVEFKLKDAFNNEWIFQDKVTIPTDKQINDKSQYPQPGVIACKIIKKWKANDGRDILTINTKEPWNVETINGDYCFNILAEDLNDMR